MITRAIRAIGRYLTGPIPAAEQAKAAQLEQANATDWGDEQLSWLRAEITQDRLDRIKRRAGWPRA